LAKIPEGADRKVEEEERVISKIVYQEITTKNIQHTTFMECVTF